MTSPVWVFRKHWHPRHHRLARLRALYWIVVRRHETEICGRCGSPVRVVFHVPSELWVAASGFPDAADGAGVLCIPCLDQLATEAGLPYLRWTCSTSDPAVAA